jgi:hypothetical protein
MMLLALAAHHPHVVVKYVVLNHSQARLTLLIESTFQSVALGIILVSALFSLKRWSTIDRIDRVAERMEDLIEKLDPEPPED